jgi:PAS domain S-box-containing protein
MINLVRFVGIVLLLVLGNNSVILAQTFKFNTLPKGVSLPVQNVLKVEQDSLGRMWFATARGIYYSDGIQTYGLPDSLIAKFEFRISMLIDEEGIIWLYNQNGLPKLFKGGYGKWEEVVLPVDFGTKQSNRINFFVKGKAKDKQFFLDNEETLFTWSSGGKDFIKIPRPNFAEFGNLFSVSTIDQKNYFFFETATFTFIDAKFQEIKMGGVMLPSPPLLVRKSPYSGEYYFLGSNFLAKGPEFDQPTTLIDTNISEIDFLREPYFGLFFKDDNVFYYFNSQLRKFASYNKFPLILDLNNLLNSFYIHEGFIDREGILWIVTSRGVVNINSLEFQNYGRFRVGLMAEEISAILDLGGGDFLFGFNNGIQKFSKMKMTTVYKDLFSDGTPQERIVNFSQDPKSGEVWFSANLGGVGKYFPKTGKTVHFKPPHDTAISSVEVAGDSVLLVGPKSVFIAPISAKGSELYQRDLVGEIQKLINQPIFFLRKAAKLKDGRIVVLAGKKYIDQPALQENNRFVVVQGFDVLETDQGMLIGTDTGLKIFKDNKVVDYELNGQRIDNPVYCILKDSKDNIWLGTDFGIVKLTQKEFIRYDESNGLIGNEINRGALIESESGRIIIGTQKGFSVFFPEEKFHAKGSPKIHLISYKVGEFVPLDSEEIIVPYTENSFQAEFMAPGFNESRELWVHYRLQGLEKEDWKIIRDPKSTKLYFNNLPAGDYQLELKSSYEGVDFSQTVFSKPFTIQKPFYLQFWFIFVTCVFLVGIGFLINELFQQLKKLGLLKVAFDTKEKEKMAAEEQFKNVWDSSKDALILTLDAEEIVTVNPAFAKLTRENPHLLSGRNINELFTKADFCEKDLGMKDPEKLKKLPQGISLEAFFPWKSGILEMQLFVKLIQEDYQGKNLVLCVFRDISAEKAIENQLREAKEKAEEANRFKSSLLSNISHEIRTPLNGILGGTEHIMMNRAQDHELISQLDIILQSGERLLGTINSILDMAKIEANKMEIYYQEVELVQYFKTIIMPLKTLAKQKQIEVLEYYLQPAILGQTDKRFLEMILNNLLSNAIKYTDEGQILLTIDLKDSNLIMEIQDTGIGMSPDYFKKIFQPFEQESTGNARLYDGTGLGLSITKNLVNLLGGQITIESEKNSGTLVKLQIPV